MRTLLAIPFNFPGTSSSDAVGLASPASVNKTADYTKTGHQCEFQTKPATRLPLWPEDTQMPGCPQPTC